MMSYIIVISYPFFSSCLKLSSPLGQEHKKNLYKPISFLLFQKAKKVSVLNELSLSELSLSELARRSQKSFVGSGCSCPSTGICQYPPLLAPIRKSRSSFFNSFILRCIRDVDSSSSFAISFIVIFGFSLANSKIFSILFRIKIFLPFSRDLPRSVSRIVTTFS